MSAFDPVKIGKVAVLMGGWSAEREVSLKSGGAVFEALRRCGVNAHAIDVDRNVVQELTRGNFDRVFNVLHGRGGEDGVIQGVLELLQLPYTGSGVLGSALGMDKLRTKQMWQAVGLPTPEYRVLNSAIDADAAAAELGLPLMIKPVLEGSSIGMSKVSCATNMARAWRLAKKYDCDVIAEQWIHGKEYTAAVLNGRVLPMIRLETPHDFYDYEAKYQANDTRYHCPCGLSEEQEREAAGLVLEAFHAVGAGGWGRVDFMMDACSKVYLIEINTVPGMTDHSLVPMAARQAGLSFDQLVMEILMGGDVK